MVHTRCASQYKAQYTKSCFPIQGPVHTIMISSTGPSTENHDFQYRAQYTKLCCPVQDPVHKIVLSSTGPNTISTEPIFQRPQQETVRGQWRNSIQQYRGQLKNSSSSREPRTQNSINSTEANTQNHAFQYRDQYTHIMISTTGPST